MSILILAPALPLASIPDPLSPSPSPSQVQQDCDDDGEAAAGGRLLHLLQIVDAKNVVGRNPFCFLSGAEKCPRLAHCEMK